MKHGKSRFGGTFLCKRERFRISITSKIISHENMDRCFNDLFHPVGL